jgi:alpha-D-xyloside xylohydrolase
MHRTERRLMVLLASVLAGALACQKEAPKKTNAGLHTPRWAFEPWISKDISDTDDTYAFVAGFQSRNIPVGVVVLDSPWETNYNDFTPNPVRYHDFKQMVGNLKAQNIRTVLWITPFVNQTSFDFETGGDTYPNASPTLAEGLSNGYFINDGALHSWWKGSGAAVDFLNPDAVKWWHAQQDAVIDSGVVGWKLDFGDEYIKGDTIKTKAGVVPHQQYAEAYYHDFLAYGLQRGGPEFTTMVRAWDESYGLAGHFFAKKEDAPVTWMGDNRRDWVGLTDALNEMFLSARGGYQVVGSDIGGYLDRDDLNLNATLPFDTEVFLRWTAIGALSPFMELHGRANITPWTVPDRVDESVAAYTYWATLHHELIPFFFSLTEEAYAGGANVLEPVGAAAEWAGDFRFILGNSLLVAPLLDGTGHRDVKLPVGERWYDWFHPSAQPIEGGTTLTAYDSTDSIHLPLFVRGGAIIPVDASATVTGLGTAASANAQTWLIYPGTAASGFTLHETDDSKTTLNLKPSGTGVEIALSRSPRAALFRVPWTGAANVSRDGAVLVSVSSRAELDAASSGQWVDAAQQFLWIKTAASGKAQTILAALP